MLTNDEEVLLKFAVIATSLALRQLTFALIEFPKLFSLAVAALLAHAQTANPTASVTPIKRIEPITSLAASRVRFPASFFLRFFKF